MALLQVKKAHLVFCIVLSCYSPVKHSFFATAVPDCGWPGTIANGTVSNIGTTVNSTAMYSCNAGYTLNGDVTRTCQSTGQWNGTAPTCSIKIVGYKEACNSNGPPEQCSTTKNAICLNDSCLCYSTAVYNEQVQACVDRIRPHLLVTGRWTDRLSFIITKGNEPGSVFKICRMDGLCKDVHDGNLTVIFTDLQAGVCYSFNVTVTNDTNAKTGMTRNVCTRPVQPTDMQIKTRSNRMLVITWNYTATCDSINATIRRYYSIYHTSIPCHTNSQSAYSLTFTKLISSKHYTIELYANLHGIHSFTSVITSCTDPDYPKMCTFAERTGTSVILQWLKGYNQCDYFDINGTAVNCKTNDDGFQYSLQQENLHPSHKYIYPVRAVLNCNDSISTACNICVTTLPPEPTHLKIGDVHNASVNVMWTGKGGGIHSFNVEIDNMNDSSDSQCIKGIKNTSNQVLTLIHRLTAASLYRVVVFSVKNDTCPQGGQLNSALNVSTTFYTRPNTPVVQIRFTNVTTYGFTVEWANNTSVCQSYRVIVGSSENNVTKDTSTGGSGSFAVPFYMLQPGQLYNAKLYTVMNGTILSEAPAESSTYTGLVKPTFIHPPNQSSIGYDSVTIYRSDTPVEVFHHWHVIIWNAEKSDIVTNVTFSYKVISGTITGLSPGTEYWIQFYTTFYDCESERTALSNFSTNMPWVDPESIIVKANDTNGITIEWKSPYTVDKSLYTYGVRLNCSSPNGDQIMINKGIITQTTVATNNLDSGSRCTIYIMTYVNGHASRLTVKVLREVILNSDVPAAKTSSASSAAVYGSVGSALGTLVLCVTAYLAVKLYSRRRRSLAQKKVTIDEAGSMQTYENTQPDNNSEHNYEDLTL